MGRHKEYWSGYRRMIIELCMEYGLVPRRYLSTLIAPNEKVMSRKIIEMINEGILIKHSYDGKTVIGLNKNNINLISEFFGYDIKSRYINYSEKIFDEYRWKRSHHQQNRRIYETGAIGCMFYGICDSISGEKKEIEKTNAPTFYTTIDYKKKISDGGNIGTLLNNASRNYGLLKNNKNLYLIYIMKKKYDIDYITEVKTITSLNRNGASRDIGEYKGSLMFVKDYDVIKELLNNLSHPNVSVIRNVFKCCRVYEMTKEGKSQLELFIKGYDIPKMILTADQIRGAKDLTCDGYDEKGYHLVFCDPDIVKLMDFIDLSMLKDKDFYLYIFRDQLPMVEHLKTRMKIKIVNYEKFCETFLQESK